MRILQLGKYYEPYLGGIETHLSALCAGLREAHQVQVLVCNSETRTVRERVRDIDVTRAAVLARALSTDLCPALIQELSRRTYDVLHLHTPNPMGMLAYVLARKPPKHRLVITHHSDIVRQARLRSLLAPLFSSVMARADVILATSPNYALTSAELAPYMERVRVVPYGLDAAPFEDPLFEPRARELRARFGPRVVLGAGRLIYYKGFDVLIRAMASLDAHLVLVGDGPLRATLQDLVRSLGISDRVTFAGGVPQHEMPAYYRAADVFVLPSTARSEAFGIVQLEAMASGLPVVNTSLDSGVPYVSADGESGLTVPSADVPALARAVESLLGDERWRSMLGQSGRERVRRLFTVERMVASVLTAYGADELAPAVTAA